MTYQRFLVAMMTTPDAKLANADTQKLADKYQVKLSWAEMALRHWRVRT